jgi:hypothetical protein
VSKDEYSLKLVVISEYGEEFFESAVLDYRTKLTRILNRVFNENPVFRSGDIGMRMLLKHPPEIEAVTHNTYPPNQIVEESGSTGQITYHHDSKKAKAPRGRSSRGSGTLHP